MKKHDKFLIIFCSAFVFIIGALIFILPAKRFSEKENRYLTELSAPSVEKILNGSYSEEISNFYTDQLPLRDGATALYALCEKGLGKREINGVITYGSQLIARSKKTETPKTDMPAIWIESKYSLFEKDPQRLSLYYNTDHHRNAEGAYLVYLEACEKLAVSPYEKTQFARQKVCSDFLGTAFARSCLPSFAVEPDTIYLYRYQNDESIKITVHDTGKSFYGFYDFSKLDTVDKYAVFLGGNYAHASIFSSDEKPTLLLIKDSFANAVVPLLSRHFNIELVDPRYLSPSQLKSLVSSLSYDRAIIIACCESFG